MDKIRNMQVKYGVRIGIILLSLLFLCTFLARKEGYHMDEILAFQLANAEYNPWIVPTQPVGRLAKFMAEHIEGENVFETASNIAAIVQDTLTNKGNSILAGYEADVYDAPVWMSREMFQDYVQCNAEDDFNLSSVYFNVKDDNHPPLHFMLLHIICSLFKGDISAWQGGVINLAAIAGILWILGLCGDILFKRRESTYGLMLLYGFSMAAVGTSLWLRMYGLLTFFVVWNFYLHLKKLLRYEGQSFLTYKKDGRKEKWIGSTGIWWATMLAFWTQYFGLFFILPMALVTTIILFWQKRIREMWAYIRTMATAGLIAVAVYPFAIGDVLFSSRGTEALGQWSSGFGIFAERVLAFYKILAANVAGNGILLAGAALVPLGVLLWQRLQGKKVFAGGFIWMLWIFPTLVYFALASKMSPFYVDRYIMAMFPMTALCIVWLWDAAFGSMSGKRVWLPMAAALLLAGASLCSMGTGHPYLYTGYEKQLALSEEYEQYPLVCLYTGYGFYENVMEMERYARTILVKPEELSLMDEAHTKVTESGYVALIKYAGEDAGREKLLQVMDCFGGSKYELIFAGGAFGDAVYLITP